MEHNPATRLHVVIIAHLKPTTDKWISNSPLKSVIMISPHLGHFINRYSNAYPRPQSIAQLFVLAQQDITQNKIGGCKENRSRIKIIRLLFVRLLFTIPRRGLLAACRVLDETPEAGERLGKHNQMRQGTNG